MDGMKLRQAFLDGETIAGVGYQHNDYVRVIDEQYKGINGSLISLEAITPEPTFLIELEGSDAKVRQSQICFISHD